MKKKKKSPSAKTLLYLVMVPIIATSLFAFGKKELSSSHRPKALTVMIDASHGGDDPGASQGSLTEKDLSLTFARLVRTACEEKEMKCVMTRHDDRTISLKERLEAAKSVSADLFLSIHVSNDENESNRMNILVSKAVDGL